MFLAPNFDCFTIYDAFCSHSVDSACLRRLRHIVMKRFEITENFYSFKALLKMAGGGEMHPLFKSASSHQNFLDPFQLLGKVF